MRRLITGLAVAATALVAVAPAARADVTPEYFTPPTTLKVGEGLDAAPNGIVYYGASDGTELPPIGRLNTAFAVPGTAAGFTGVKTPDLDGCCSAQIRDVSYSPKLDSLYYTRSDGGFGRLTGEVASLVTTPGQVAPFGIAAAVDGSAWMTEYGAGPGPSTPARLGSRVAQVSPELGLKELPNLAAQTGVFDDIRFDAQPKGITLDGTGTPWFVEANPGNPGYRIAKVAGSAYVEYSAPCVSASPCSGSFTPPGLEDVAAGLDGSIWYTDARKGVVGRLRPGGTITEYTLNSLGTGLGAGKPRGISAAPDGSIWVADFGYISAPGANAIIKLVPSATGDVGVTVYKTGAAVSPFAVSPDTKGNVWFSGTAATGPGAIGRLAGVTEAVPVDPGPGTPTPVASPTPTPTTTVKPTTTTTARITDPRVSGTSITANQICVGPPEDKCSLVYLIQTHEYVKGFPNTKGYAAKATLTTIGKATVTLKGGQSKKVTVKLNRKGKKLLKKLKKFKATLTVTQSRNGAKPKQLLKKNVKFKK